MGTQQFCLKWNKHHSNILDVFCQLLSTEALVDVTLACEGVHLKAHKMVLSACSPFFHSMFLENPCKHPIVILPKDIRYSELKAIIDFMYRGEVNIAQDQLPALLRTAETLKVKGLTEAGNHSSGSGTGSRFGMPLLHSEMPHDADHMQPWAYRQVAHESPLLNKRKRVKPRKRPLDATNQSDSEDQTNGKTSRESNLQEGINGKCRHLEPSVNNNSQPSSVAPSPQPLSNPAADEISSSDADNKDHNPTKLLEQTLVDEDVPAFPEGQSQGIGSNSYSIHSTSSALFGATNPQQHLIEGAPSLSSEASPMSLDHATCLGHLAKSAEKGSSGDTFPDMDSSNTIRQKDDGGGGSGSDHDDDMPLLQPMTGRTSSTDQGMEQLSQTTETLPLIPLDQDLFKEIELGSSVVPQQLHVPSVPAQKDERVHAIRSVLKDGMSIRKAAKIYQIPRTTLRRSVATYKSKGIIP